MSPRPIEEPDENENEPDENEPDENSPQTPTPTGSTGKGHHHASPTGSPTNDPASLPSSSSSNNSVPASTLGPVIVAIVVILVIITCCILHCARIRRRMNDEQRTQTINGWTSFLSQLRNKQTAAAPPDVERAVPAIAAADIKEKKNPRRKPLKKRDYDRAFHYRMNKPPPLPPYEEEEVRGERQPSIVFSPGWLFAFSDKQNEAESKNSKKHLINEVDGASVPLPPPPEPPHADIIESDPERLCPHQVTVDEPVASQKPNQKTLEP